MKKLLLFILAIMLVVTFPATAQNNEQPPVSKKKTDQSKLYNEVFIGYGIGSLYLFTGTVEHSNYSYIYGYNSSETDVRSDGALIFGYNRMLNRVVMLGFTGSYFNVNYDRTYSPGGYGNNYVGIVKFNDNLLSGMAKITFNYVNKPMIRVYSSIGMGITVDLASALGNQPGDVKQTDRKIFPSGQLTFMGLRFGRTFGGFCEFGIGTNAIVTGGINYQFGD